MITNNIKSTTGARLPFMMALVATALLATGCSRSEPASAPTSGAKPAAGQEDGVAAGAEQKGELAAAPAQPRTVKRAACDSLPPEKLKEYGFPEKGAPSTSGGADACTWLSDDFRGIVVQIYPTAGHYDRAREAFESLHGGKVADLRGTGDKAFYIHGKISGFQTATITAQKASSVISVQVMDRKGEVEALKANAVSLTQDMLSNL